MTDLSVVIPAYNEARTVSRFLTALDTALTAAGFDHCEVVLVDDGSSDGTAELAAATSTAVAVRVIRQDNAGRFEARRTGIHATAYDPVMLVDCGLELLPGSLPFLRDQLQSHPERALWNGHVEIDTTDNPYASFWSAIVRLFWGAYLRHPTLTSFGLDDFDRFPKGTTLFVAPAAALRRAVDEFRLAPGAEHFASDDTRLIRSLLDHSPRIWIDPGFGCRYVARSTLAEFVAHCTFRGTTFVDGYWDSSSLLGRLVRTMAWLGPVLVVAVAVALVLAPIPAVVAVLVTVAVGALLFFLASLLTKTPARTAAWGALLLPVFAVTFGAGALRGVLLRYRRRGAAG
jgi:glycosyltransferase involved in cell wall biosynthesis